MRGGGGEGASARWWRRTSGSFLCSAKLALFRLSVCSSLVEEDKLELAKSLEAKAAAKGVKIILPTDVVLADKFSADANTKVSRPPRRPIPSRPFRTRKQTCEALEFARPPGIPSSSSRPLSLSFSHAARASAL